MKKAYAIGLDIGGSKIRGILWDGKKVLRAMEKPTPKNLKLFKENISTIIITLSKNKIINKIGIGAAASVRGSVLKSCTNIPYIKNFETKILAPSIKNIRVDNDATTFALAESKLHSKKHILLAITLGTGIGRALVRNGKFIFTKRFTRPERWEKEYQKIRNSRDDKKLVNFLSKKIFYLLKIYPAEALIVGGGVAERKGLILKLRTSLQKEGINMPIFKSKLGKNAVAIGALL